MWLWLMQLGFAGFLIGLFAFIWRGCDREGRLRARGAWWLLFAFCCFALWFVALPRIPRP